MNKILCILVSFLVCVLASNCNEKCPFGNNDCVNLTCTRCFPLFQHDWSKGVCGEPAMCGDGCTVNTDCNQNSECKLCVSNICSVGGCGLFGGGPCQEDQDCVLIGNPCSMCDPVKKICIDAKTFACPQQKAYSFSTTQAGMWYFPERCINQCQTIISRAMASPSTDYLSLVSANCSATTAQQCVCKGAQTDSCYGQGTTYIGSGIESANAYCYGQFTIQAELAQPSGPVVYNVLNSFSLQQLSSTVQPSNYVSFTFQHNAGDSQSQWHVHSQVYNNNASLCYDNPVTVPNAPSGLTNLTISWEQQSIIWMINGQKFDTFSGTPSCPIPPSPLYVSFYSLPTAPLPNTVAQSQTNLYSFTYSPNTSFHRK